MADSIKVDVNELYHFATQLGKSAGALQVNDPMPDAGQVGNNDVYHALDHFFGNWKYKRNDLIDRLNKLSQGVSAAATAYQETEGSLSKAFTPSDNSGSGPNKSPGGGGGSGGGPPVGSTGTSPTLVQELSRKDSEVMAQFKKEWGPPDKDGMDAYRFMYNPAGNCTSFAAWRLNELAKAQGSSWSMTNFTVGGVNVSSGLGKMGNAGTWGDGATSLGHPPDTTPTPGAVAWWAPDKAYKPEGHVGIVRAVHPDGSIEVEESSWGGPLFTVKTYAKNEYPTGFLHLMPGT